MMTAITSPVATIFFFNDTATTEIYTLSLHDALPIYIARRLSREAITSVRGSAELVSEFIEGSGMTGRSEEHTSELQSPDHLVCRLLLEKKKEHEQANNTLRVGAQHHSTLYLTQHNQH